MRYHGGKWKLAKWIISYFPSHRIYTESFGGAASVLIQKPRSYAEVYNDLNSEIVNVFRVLRNTTQSNELIKLLELTPFAREEFELSYTPANDPVEQARRTIARTFMGFGSTAFNSKVPTGFRANSNRSGTTPAHDWQHYPNAVPALVKRLGGVVIENRPAIEVILQHDSDETLHYVDPPYVHETRKARQRRNYTYEMTNEDHVELARVLKECAGMVIVSGYNCELYESLYSDWLRVDKIAFADGARKRIESLWLSPNVAKKMDKKLL